ncbi:MAG: polysaccharide biosynthesis tyrosine autokinase, partial [Gammaproteobacteria bacterium]|nr:polysaccharide biosynthesis tyrosine autokinase [Gammaproteobacteria bacterium]
FKPNKTRIILVAAVLGLMLGIALAFLREHFDRTLKTLDDIEEKLALTALGIIPLVRERKKSNPDTQYLSDPRSPFAEKINHIRTGLLFSSIDDPPRTLLITSATSGEGKTTAAINLAAAFAQLDRTLLVEVDLRKPTLRERLHAAPRKGLADLVLDPGLAREVIQPVDGADKLHLLTCGTRPANPLELLSSQQFQALLNKLQQHYRFIVLDGPPLLAVSDAAVLGHIVDETIMVAKAESTSIKMIKDASALLRKANLLPVGVILAQADSKRMAYYGGGYYHYDQRYYGEGSDSAKAGG